MNKQFNIQGLTRLNEDSCFKKLNNKTIQMGGKYRTRNYNQTNDCELPNVKKISMNQPHILYKEGYGWISKNGCNIDKDSKFRNSRNLTNLNAIHQLNVRPHKTTPYLINCNKNIKRESKLLFSKSTNMRRANNTLSGITINRFIPQIPKIKKNIQNPKNIVQEMNNKDWIRGGQPSRQYIKNKEYLKKCMN